MSPQHVSLWWQERFRGWLGTAIHSQQTRAWKPSHQKVLMDSQRSETGPHQKTRAGRRCLGTKEGGKAAVPGTDQQWHPVAAGTHCDLRASRDKGR